MNIPKRAIEKAIEGGWKGDWYVWAHAPAIIALDPTFWQALCKALGWSLFVAYKNGQWINENEDNRALSDTPFRLPNWQWKAHGFYDLILQGQSTDTFWEELLAAKE